MKALAGWHAAHFSEPPSLAHPLLVAYSGGADSTALLLIAAAIWPGLVQAVHVHHGLQPAADSFVEVCRALCAERGIALKVLECRVVSPPGASLEERARSARYAALGDMAKDVQAQAVLLAQHADDQAETVMLALSRGAGVKGLAGMGGLSMKGGVAFGRPFLGQPGAVLRHFVLSNHVVFVDDPSNLDVRFTRNKIRHQVMPTLVQAFPQVSLALARSARHAAQAAELLDDLARLDEVTVGTPPRISRLQSLSRVRQANLLRHWLYSLEGTLPSEAQLLELLRQVGCCTTRGHRIQLKVGAGQVVRCGDVLSYQSGV